MSEPNTDFIKKLAEQTGLEEPAAKEKLQELTRAIQNELKEHSRFAVPGLGEFILKDGELTFSPDEELAIEVNYKYAGMTPIQIMPGYKKKASETAEESKETSEKPEEKESTAPATESEKKESPQDRLSTLASGMKSAAQSGKKSDEQSKKPAEPKPTQPESKKETPKVPPAAKKSEEKPKPAAQKPEPVASRKKTETPKPEPEPVAAKQQTNPWIVVFSAIAGIALIGLILWLVQSGSPAEEAPEQPAVTETQPAPPVSTQPEQTETPPAEPEPETPTAEPEVTQTPYGLRGELSDVSNYFTIVVVSLRNEQRARTLRDELISEGWRVTLTSIITTEGHYNFRVGIGQFETVSSAENAVNRLPEPYRSNNFISRVR